ncbi:MAG: GMC family oxidoreductase [Nitrospirae bacterium]|nr:GMC family oxidoreductase [Nitrospirota bacterium]
MIIDLNNIKSDPFQNKVFDICICGGGVAGITLAVNLSKQFNVALLEAGGFEYSEESQEVYKGRIIGREYYPLEETRMRFFGGSSNVWAGFCRPLDYYDFEPKKYVEYSGWPINRNDLDPYLEKAKSILDIPDDKEAPKDQFTHLLNKSADFKKIDFWFSKPTNFGEKFGNEITNAENILCCLNANVTDIILSEDLSRVKKIKVQNYAGKSYMLNVKTFILAAGGIENARIMLNCNRQIKEGLGNSTGLVGRFFAEHLHYAVGELILEDRFRNCNEIRTYAAPSERFMQKENILNLGLRIIRCNQNSSQYSFKMKIKNILCEWSPDLVESVFSSKCRYADQLMDRVVRIISEQAPNFSSAVLCDAEVDKFKMRRAALDWTLSPIDVRTIKNGVIHFGKTVASLGLGRLKVVQWLLSEDPKFPGIREDETGGNHHMCTTRMGTSPKNGVVDSNQKVFGIGNFYVAGSSVFSTGGHANPTFTIVQMSLRLADYLNKYN